MRRHCLAFLVTVAASPAFAGVRVDISPNVDRREIVTPGWENWKVTDGPSATAKFSTITATLRPAGPVGAGLTATVWWKRGFDFKATMASDGVTVRGGDKGGRLELVLRGLTPGRHSVVTYHSTPWEAPASALDIVVDGTVKLHGVRPSRHVTDNADAASTYFEVEATAGQDVVIEFRPDGTGAIDNAFLNGFEIDTPDPTHMAAKPVPADGDEHTPEEPVLTWRRGNAATAHHVYFGTDLAAVARATPGSPEFKGAHTEPRFATAGLPLDAFTSYYWRVDAVHPNGTLPGPVWRFRVRHLAFPGAEGYGRFAIGGRAGRVIEVTNLNDSGPGSLREAVEADGPRTVVFRVGGTIALKSKLLLRNPYLTIAGQTAPGDGICLRGWSVGGFGGHDIIMRHVRIRIGDEAGRTLDGTGLASCDHSIIDHCSVSWSIDEAFSSRGAKNITLQRTILAEALNLAGHDHYIGTGKGHSFAASVSGRVGSLHHNLLANCAGRNWSLAGGFTWGGAFDGHMDIRNNVVYNWSHRTTDGGVKALNFVGNLYLPGPASRKFVFLEPDAGTPADRQQYYLAGNVMEGKPEFDADNWKGATTAGRPLAAIRVDQPFFEPHVRTHTAWEAYDNVLADVGATLPKQDVLDARYIREVRARKHTYTGSRGNLPGVIDSQKDVGGYPEYKSGAAPADGDHDGMPDWWEAKHSLNPSDPSDGPKDADRDGFTNLEEYLNGTDPKQYVDYRKPENNRDVLTAQSLSPTIR